MVGASRSGTDDISCGGLIIWGIPHCVSVRSSISNANSGSSLQDIKIKAVNNIEILIAKLFMEIMIQIFIRNELNNASFNTNENKFVFIKYSNNPNYFFEPFIQYYLSTTIISTLLFLLLFSSVSLGATGLESLSPVNSILLNPF